MPIQPFIPLRALLPALLLGGGVGVLPGQAQAQAAASASAEAPVQALRPENVRTDYARVLKVEPVYETLRATTARRVCEDVPVARAKPRDENGRLARVWDSVKGVFSGEEESPPAAPATVQRCRTVQIPRTFQRPIAYDVDYIYRGMKYRSRLPEDPGSRVRIRISVQPVLAEQGVQP